MSEVTKIEYQVREVTRYQVTGFIETGHMSASTQHGEFENADTAYQVAYALCKDHRDRAGLLPGSDAIKFPQHPIRAIGEERLSYPE